MEVEGVEGDGYCFLNAVVAVLSNIYGKAVSVEQCMQTIMKYLCSNFEKYTKYHCQGKEDIEPTIADTLIADVIDFFSSRNFDMNVVDLLSQITADVMELELYIYQNNNGQIQVIHFTRCDNVTRIVRLKFTHDNLHPQGNHYEAIVRKKKTPSQPLPFYSDTMKGKKEGIFKNPNNTGVKKEAPQKEKETIFIDLTDDSHDDNECILPPMRRRRHCSGENTSSTDPWSDETYISSDSENHYRVQSPIFGIPVSKPWLRHQSTPSTMPSFSSGNESPFVTPSTSSTSLSSENDSIFNDPKYLENLEAQSLAENVSCGKPFPLWYFNEKIPEEVTHIPHDIDGICFYQITVSDHRWHGPTSDRRHFRMMTTMCKDFNGEVRLGFCQGSFVCTNTNCPFRRTSYLNQLNKVSWRNVRGVREYKVCAICDETAERIDCTARKMVEYDYGSRIAKVYHIGWHKCWPQVTQQSTRIIQHLNNPGHRKGSAKDVGLEEIVNLIDA